MVLGYYSPYIMFSLSVPLGSGQVRHHPKLLGRKSAQSTVRHSVVTYTHLSGYVHLHSVYHPQMHTLSPTLTPYTAKNPKSTGASMLKALHQAPKLKQSTSCCTQTCLNRLF